jgi:hypothetical protein
MRYFLPAAVLFALVATCQRGHAHDWQGYAMNHRERTIFGYEPRGSAQIITIPYADEAAARDKALRDEVTCAPVVEYRDDGRHVFPALGCRR